MKSCCFLKAAPVLILTLVVQLCAAQGDSLKKFPVSFSVYDRTRVDIWKWFAAPPYQNEYAYLQSLLRFGISQHVKRWDWQLEGAQTAILAAPSNAVSPMSAQGQLGLGATYYQWNGNNAYPAAFFLKQGFVRYQPPAVMSNVRIGRFEFIDGQEIHAKNQSVTWIQNNRIAHRLIGNFAFSEAQRSFDGIEGHFGSGSWDTTALGARADQGVFNMNGNPELNVDLQYLALSHLTSHDRMLWRAFAIGYHDGRTGLTKTDNRALAVRQTDHANIRIGTYGGNLVAVAPAGPGQFDFLTWGALQNGRWGNLNHQSKAGAVEAGYQLVNVPSMPWIRGGYFYGSGDINNSDNLHQTFFQLLPTPRIYARSPFFNLMNNRDGFVQIIDRPGKSIEMRADLHWLKLTSNTDLWYSGGGAFDNKVFGYTGRPSNDFSSLASFVDLSSDWQATSHLAINFYFTQTYGRTVISAIYPAGATERYGYIEMVYRWSRNLTKLPQK